MASQEILFAPEQPSHHAPSRAPVWKTMGYTLKISAQFLLSAFAGKGSVQRADDLIAWYWKRIFISGNATLIAEGRDQIPRGQTYVYMSNHSSLLDIPILFGAVPGSLRMVSKQELTRIPVWGQAIIASGFIPVDRKNLKKAIEQLETAKVQLAKGVNVWLSPEGTRTRTGRLAPFKKGGFHTALSLAVPIVPVWIEGAQTVLAPDQFLVNYDKTITVRFGKPIPTAGLTKDDLPKLMAQVRTSMVELSGRPDDQAVPETRARAA